MIGCKENMTNCVSSVNMTTDHSNILIN